MNGPSAKILADSVSPSGHRLTTFEVTFARIVLAEVNTHRMLSRSSASSRAIPVEKMLKRVESEPYVPSHWGKNQKGMQAEVELEASEQKRALSAWLCGRDQAVEAASALLGLDVHKQITNRLLEPFMWHTAIISGTDWSNLFHLRDHEAAHPDLALPVRLMRAAYGESRPKLLHDNEWHLPLIDEQDIEAAQEVAGLPKQEVLIRASIGRCARVSYLTHDGKRDLGEDIGLYGRILAPGHMSPLEHAARPMTPLELELFRRPVLRWDSSDEVWMPTGESDTHYLGNFNGWVQRRKLIPHEEDSLGVARGTKGTE